MAVGSTRCARLGIRRAARLRFPAFFFFKQKTAYEITRDWSSDVCSSDLWIHGGALLTGESNDYDPSGLVHHGVIVVTINYRLGALGFLAHPALAGRPGGPSGNYRFMDQQAA